jgi:hypothetical protein
LTKVLTIISCYIVVSCCRRQELYSDELQSIRIQSSGQLFSFGIILVPPEPIWIDDKDEIHSNIIEEVIPKLGMEFETEQEAYNFCNNYDRVVGFSIRQSKGQKNGLHA